MGEEGVYWKFGPQVGRNLPARGLFAVECLASVVMKYFSWEKVEIFFLLHGMSMPAPPPPFFFLFSWACLSPCHYFLLLFKGFMFGYLVDRHSADVNLLKMPQAEVNMFFSTFTHVEDFLAVLQDVQNASNIDDTAQLILIFKAALQSFQMHCEHAFDEGSDSDSSDNESERISRTSSKINFQRDLVVKKCVFQAVELCFGTKATIETSTGMLFICAKYFLFFKDVALTLSFVWNNGNSCQKPFLTSWEKTKTCRCFIISLKWMKRQHLQRIIIFIILLPEFGRQWISMTCCRMSGSHRIRLNSQRM
jgi:hypothetical protein